MTGKQLRNSILQWAIQGKLVPQDPNDEPASVLLDRIRAEKARLVNEKKIKRDKNESFIYRGEDNSYYEKLADGTVRCIDSEIPFEIPVSWAWCRLGSVSNIWSARRVHEKDWRSKGIPFYRAREIGKLADFGTVDNNLFIDRELYEEFSKSGIPQIGDLMMTAVGTLGKTYIVDTDAPFYYKDGSVLCIGNPYGFYSKYLKAFFESTIFSTQYLSESDGTTVATLTMVRMNKYLIPLPPLKEQERIMDKATSLLSLAEVYTIKQNQFEKLNSQIADLLKKSILQEAIQGRLVPQIEAEGTAEQLLEEIETEKKRLVKEGKLKKSTLAASRIFRGDDNKYYEQIGSEVLDITEEILFIIPNTWMWCRLNNLFLVNPKNDVPDDIEAAFIPMEKMNAGIGSGYSFEKHKWMEIKKGFSHFADGDIAFAKITPCFQNRKGSVFENLPNGIGAGSTELKVLRVYGDTINPYFALYFLQSPYFIDEAKFKGTANQQRIVSGYLENKLFPLPPLGEQNRIVAKIETLFKRIK